MTIVVCPSCGQATPVGFPRCANCGAPLTEAEPRRQERKVVTVLFCDLVGFTRRAETLDPEDVQALLGAYHDRLRGELERFGGTVEKFIGDAVVAVFGAPVAHEDDPERAVRAALAIREWARDEEEIDVRIAVNTGEALVTLGARPERGEGMVAGDVVNTASRLQSAAPVNGILAGEQTYRATRDEIDFREAAPVEAKGKEDRVPVWEAVEARSRLGVDVAHRGRAPLVGREHELDLLLDALARARARQPQLVTLVGVPGIGKSRLVAELFQAVELDTELITWRQGRSLPYGAGISFWALSEMVKAHAGVLETDSPEDADRKLREAVGAVVPDDGDPAWIAGHLRPLVGLGAEAELTGDRRSEAFAAWRRFLEAVAEDGPMVLVFEDLQWADDGLLDFVDHLVEWASGVPLLVVATARPELLERRAGWGGGKRNAATVSLAPLSDAETARLIGALLERPVLPADTQASLLHRAGGNPLYAEEYARMFSEGAGDDAALPETLQGIVAARLDALAPDEKALAQDAAVVGKVFWLGALGALSGRGRWELEERLHGLERKEFVRRERRSSVAGDEEYAFLHVLVRDVAYGQLPRAARAERHRRAAEWIETLGRREDTAEMLAHHYANALEYARAAGLALDDLRDGARVAFRDAGDRAAALTAFPAATRFYERALEHWPRDDPQRAELLLALARAHFNVDPSFATERLDALRDELLEAGRPEAAAEVAAMVSVGEWHVGNRERSFALMRDALTLLEDAPQSRPKATVFAELARLLILGGGGDEGPQLARQAVAIAHDLGLLDIEARALNTLAVAKVTTGDLSGLDDLRRSLALAEQANAPEDVHRAYVNLNALSYVLGDLERADEYLRQGIDSALRFGVESGLRWLRGSQSEIDYQAGRWDDAVRRCDEFLAEVEAGLPHYLEHQALFVRALVRVARGDVSGARADCDRGLRLARELEDPQALHVGLCSAAWIRLQLDDRDAAAALADEVLAFARADLRETAISWAELAVVLTALGRADELAQLAERDDRPSRWREASYAFAGGNPVRSADEFAAIGSRPMEAYARLRAAERLLGEGRRGEAEAQLTRALSFFRSAGAARFVRECEALQARSAARTA